MNDTFSIQELSEQSGLPRRTIHFYTQQGLLPPPQGAGLGARYGQEHLERLKLIPLLRKQGLRLDQIRARLHQANLEELKTIRQQFNRAPALLPEAAAEQPAAELYTHHQLPNGILIAVPASLPPAERSKVQKLLDAARHIFRD